MLNLYDTSSKLPTTTDLQTVFHIQVESLARGPKLLSMYTVKQRGFLVHKYWQTGSFKACQTAFRMEFGDRRAPSKCCIQKLVKKLKTRGSRSNACRLLSLGPIEGQSVQKYTPHNRTTQRRYTPKDSNHQRRHFGKSIPEFGETHSSVLGFERRPVSASIISRSCFASFPVFVYKFQVVISITYFFIDNSLGPLARDSPCIMYKYVYRMFHPKFHMPSPSGSFLIMQKLLSLGVNR